MKPLLLNLTVAFVAVAVGVAGTLWLRTADAQVAPATKPFVMPASMPGVAEPAAIKAQRAALLDRTGGKPAVLSSVIDVAKLAERNTDVGKRRDLFDGPSVTLTNLEGHISVLNAGEMSHPPHQHVNEEVIILMEGTLEVTINGKATTAHKGDVLLFASLDWHNVRNIGTTPALYYVFNWSAPNKPVATGAANP